MITFLIGYINNSGPFSAHVIGQFTDGAYPIGLFIVVIKLYLIFIDEAVRKAMSLCSALMEENALYAMDLSSVIPPQNLKNFRRRIITRALPS